MMRQSLQAVLPKISGNKTSLLRKSGNAANLLI